MQMGGRASVWVYCLEVLLPFAWLVGCAVGGVLPAWCLLACVAAIPAVANVRVAVSYFRNGAAAIANLDEGTAKLQLAFSLLLAVAFTISGVVS